jgi:hypothetical protein
MKGIFDLILTKLILTFWGRNGCSLPFPFLRAGSESDELERGKEKGKLYMTQSMNVLQ